MTGRRADTYVVGVFVRFAFTVRLVVAITLVSFGGGFFLIARLVVVVVGAAPGRFPTPLLFLALPLFFELVRVREPATPPFVVGPFA